MKETDAMAKGFGARQTWEELIRRKLPEIAEKIGVPPSRLEYVAAAHYEKEHPHCHILFWDKERGVKDAFVHKNIFDTIRVDLIKYVFGEEMGVLLQLKDKRAKSKPWKTFLKKKFSKPFKKLYLKPLRGFRKASRFFISRELKPLQTRAKRGFVYAVERACGL
jgi:hypothetical protein